MSIPVWVKPAAAGAVAGGIVVAIVGFAWGGWVTGGSAQASALAAADASRTDLAAAICVQNFMAEDGARERLIEFKELNRPIPQRNYIEAGDWAVMPGSDAAVRATATLCARMLAGLEPEELPVVEDGEVLEEGEIIEAEVTEAELVEAEAIEVEVVEEPAAPQPDAAQPDVVEAAPAEADAVEPDTEALPTE